MNTNKILGIMGVWFVAIIVQMVIYQVQVLMEVNDAQEKLDYLKVRLDKAQAELRETPAKLDGDALLKSDVDARVNSSVLPESIQQAETEDVKP